MFIQKKRFIGTLVVLLAVGFLATSFVSYYVAHSSLSDQIAENTLPLTSDNIYSEIQQDLLQPIFISSLMAQDTFVRDWTLSGEEDPKQIIRYLKEIQNQYDTVTAFFVSEKSRTYYHPSGSMRQISKDVPNDAWYFRVRKMKQNYEVNVDADMNNIERKGTITIFINYRVYDYAGNYIGVTGVGLAVDTVKTLIETYQNRYGRHIYFTDREGQVVLHGNQFTGEKHIRKREGLDHIATQILTTPSVSATFQRDGKTVYLNSRLVDDFDWILLVEEEENTTDTPIFQTLLGNLIACLVITGIVLFIANLTVGGYQRRLEEMATTDKLTGATNRQAFELLFDQEVKNAHRREVEIASIMFDLDHFKAVNDTYGHLAGDEVLYKTAETVRKNIREADILCRWGGEEFVILMMDCSQAKAVELAEKIRAAIGEATVHYGREDIKLTASLSVTTLRDNETGDAMLKRLDDTLYAAKKNGRNRVEVPPAI